MSLRAEALRFALRRWSKARGDQAPDVPAIRLNLAKIARFVPYPPRRVTVARAAANGVPGVRMTAPGSRKDRHVLYLHGGAYAYGSAWLYRDFVWRLAEATGATVLCIDYRLAP
jgi:monoterpene epsilon-lactone hydrolase